MKKISVLLLAGVLVSSLTFAGGRDKHPFTPAGMAVIKNSATSYKLIYKSEEASDVKIQIFDGNDELVYRETVKMSDGFSRPYNFSNLPAGDYTIKIDNGSNWLTETVAYRAGQPEKLAHLVQLNPQKYLLTVAGNGQEKLKVSIFNADGDAVYNAYKSVNGDFAQVFDLSQLKGAFSFEITDASGASKILKR